MALKAYNQQLEDKTANDISFGCSRKEVSPVITETDIEITKKTLWSNNVKKILCWENLFSKT